MLPLTVLHQPCPDAPTDSTPSTLSTVLRQPCPDAPTDSTPSTLHARLVEIPTEGFFSIASGISNNDNNTPVICKYDVIRISGSTQRIATPPPEKTEPRPRVACIETLVKFERVGFELCKRTDRQTDRQTATLIAVFRPGSHF